MSETRKPFSAYNFPSQRVSSAERDKPEWYANCIDYVIDAGLACNDRDETEKLIAMLNGAIPEEYYKKTLNPYNSDKERYKRFPATLRNYDIMSGISRRYISEYYTGAHDFNVGANSSDIVLKKNAKLQQEVLTLCQQAFAAEIQKNMQAAAQQGQDVSQMSQEDFMPDMEEFVKNFEENYIDDQSAQGQRVLEYIRDNTDDLTLYLKAVSDYVNFGECYSYAEVYPNKIVKEIVPPVYAYPVPNGNMFVEDFDMFARKIPMTYQQIIDNFGDDLDPRDLNFLQEHYAHPGALSSPVMLNFNQYFERYPDVCGKLTDEETKLFKDRPIMLSDANTNMFAVWHVVWRGERKQGILTYINEMGMQAETIVDDTFEFNPELGHINIEWVYVPQVYEGYRIGLRSIGIYPIKARAIAYNRNGKLPYNGIMEVLPGLGQFSIVRTVTPYQILRNIIFYHREMVIAKNKMLILLVPESLVADNSEDRIYKMAADGVLLYDDSDDSGSVKAQQIRLLNANLNNYISELTQLCESIKLEAREAVDMNEQRFGQINQSAGKGITEEAISRSSMGSVIIYTMFDEFRRKDYDRDIDYAKLAYIDGLDVRYRDKEGNNRYMSLDVNSYVSADYSTMVRNNEKEHNKIRELKQWAFSAAQNGDLDMAIAAICNDNVATIKNTVNKFMDIKRQHESELKQADQQLEQMKEQFELQKIAAQGEEDRKTEELKAYLEMQQSYIDLDVSMFQNPFSREQAEAQLKQTAEASKHAIEQQKLSLEQQKIQADMYSAAADRQVKREEIAANIKIARTNKNKYDK